MQKVVEYGNARMSRDMSDFEVVNNLLLLDLFSTSKIVIPTKAGIQIITTLANESLQSPTRKTQSPTRKQGNEPCLHFGLWRNVHRARRVSKGYNVIFLANSADSDNFYTPAL